MSVVRRSTATKPLGSLLISASALDRKSGFAMVPSNKAFIEAEM